MEQSNFAWEPGGYISFTPEDDSLYGVREFNHTGIEICQTLTERHNYAVYHGIELGFEVIATCLVGSQNYCLETRDSDYDTISIVLPTWEHHMTCGDKMTHTYTFEDGLATICSYKDFLANVRKLSHISLEPLFTEWSIVNPKYSSLWNILRDNRVQILYSDQRKFFNSAFGYGYSMMKKAFDPNRPAYNVDLGYDPKAVSHWIRNLTMIQLYNAKFDNIYHTNLEKWLCRVKSGEKMSLARSLFDMFNDLYLLWENHIKEQIYTVDKDVEELYKEWLMECGRKMVESYNGEGIKA